MAKKGEIFKTIILFLFFLFGCSHKYVNAEGESLDGKVVDSWEELDADIIRVYEGKIRLNIHIKDFDIVSGFVKSEKLYARRSSDEGVGWVLLGMAVGLGGCYYGFDYGCIQNDFMHPDHEREDRGCLISVASCVTGCSMFLVGVGSNRRKDVKPVFRFIKRDTVCVDSVSLLRQKIKILIKDSDFEKIYWTDEKGNIELKFDEIIPEPTETDSVLNLIIKYKEMVDTVDLRIE